MTDLLMTLFALLRAIALLRKEEQQENFLSCHHRKFYQGAFRK